MVIIAVIVILLISVPVAAIIYWILHRAGLFATPEQDARFDAADRESRGR